MKIVHSLQKYVEELKVDRLMKRVKKGKWYPNKDCKHIKMKLFMFLKGGHQVINGLVGEKHRKLNQFATIVPHIEA